MAVRGGESFLAVSRRGYGNQVGVGATPDPATGPIAGPGQQAQHLLVYVLLWAYEIEIKAQPTFLTKDL